MMLKCEDISVYPERGWRLTQGTYMQRIFYT